MPKSNIQLTGELTILPYDVLLKLSVTVQQILELCQRFSNSSDVTRSLLLEIRRKRYGKYYRSLIHLLPEELLPHQRTKLSTLVLLIRKCLPLQVSRGKIPASLSSNRLPCKACYKASLPKQDYQDRLEHLKPKEIQALPGIILLTGTGTEIVSSAVT